MYKLRPMLEADLDLVLEWRNDPRVRANMYTYHVIDGAEHRRWYEAAARDPTKRLLMCVDDLDVPVGVVTFSAIDASHKTATWAFYSGESARRGAGSQMELLALDYAFGELGLEKLNCEVLSFNMPVVNFHRKHGFRVEGVFRRNYARDGVRHDVYRLAHFRKAWIEQVRPAMLPAAAETTPTLRPGASYREQVILSRELVGRFAEVSGDNNAVHLEDEAARAAGFDGVLVHGMLVAAVLSRIIGTVFPGPGTIYVSQSLQFHRAVYPDTPVEYLLRVAARIGRRVILTVTVSSPNGEDLVTGEAEVMVPVQGVRK